MTEPHVIYDDALCKVDIVPADYPDAYFVRLDGDDETAQACVNWEDALTTADQVRADFEEQNGRLGVGS